MILIYCCLLAMIAAFIVVNNVVRQRKRRTRVLWVAQWVQQLRCLLELFPKHRGMANALLKGDHSFRPAMEKLQREVDAKLLSMRQLVAERSDGFDRDYFHPDLLQKIEQQWQAIRDNVFTMQAKKSFTLHTRLIALVIERMEDDSLELVAFANTHRNLKSLVTMLTRELPHVVESIGQARGIGTGVAAQRSSTVANRVNLRYLHGNTLAILNNRLVTIRSVLHQRDMEQVIDNAVSSAQDFLALLHSELIDTVKPTISPEVFYQQGTAAIDAGFGLFDQLFPRCIQVLGLR